MSDDIFHNFKSFVQKNYMEDTIKNENILLILKV
jgi:hypothetical protein